MDAAAGRHPYWIKRMIRSTYILLLATCVCAVGCDSGGTHPTTPQEKKAFLGGPMPPDVRKKFEESMQAGKVKMQQTAAEKAANGGR